MTDRTGIFAGDDPFALARDWLEAARGREPNDPDAIALATVDGSGLPNVRMVLLKQIEDAGFVFYTNYTSAKAEEIASSGTAAFVAHWKSLRRQIRVRGMTEKVEGAQADAYFASRHPRSRLGAWASDQSSPLEDRAALEARLAEAEATHGDDPERPPFWGGFRIQPLEIEFWADGENRLHDRFRWSRANLRTPWVVTRLNP